MIECKNVAVRYGEKQVLRQVDLVAGEGEITVLLGKNGAGKSTLFRAISGAIPLCGGEIKLCGRSLGALSRRERARLLGIMPQMLACPDVTVRELVLFGRYPHTGFGNILSAKDREAAEAALQKTGLLPLAGMRLGAISGGERQKAYFAMLLAEETPLLLLDEPGAHLDVQYRKNLARFLTEEKARGKTVLTILHDLNFAMELADRIGVLDGGRIVFDGTPEEFAESPIPQNVFGLQRFLKVSPDRTEPDGYFFC